MTGNDKKKSTKTKLVFRIPPCADYDIAGTEQWLEEMAQQGLILKQFFTDLLAIFEQQEPQTLRYRIATVANTALMVPNLDSSLDDLKEYCAAFGWDYITRRGNFCIFMTADELARELHTDNDVQAMALDRVQKDIKTNLVLPLIWMISIPWMLSRDGAPLLNCIRLGTGTCLLIIFSVAFLIGTPLWEVIQLRKAQKVLKMGSGFEERQKSQWYMVTKILVTVLLFSGLAWMCGQYIVEKAEMNAIPLSEYTGEIPTLMLQDLVPGDIYKTTDQSDYANKIAVKSDWLAPTYMQFNQRGATVTDDEACLFEGDINVEYIETLTPAIAQRLAKEFHERDRRLWGDQFDRYEPLELPDLGVDYAIAYKNLMNNFVLAEDCKVVYVYYQQSGGSEELTLEELSQMYADSLQQ